MTRTPEDLTGMQYGRLTVVRYVGRSHWECQCACGSLSEVLASNLKRGRTRSCGYCGRYTQPTPKYQKWRAKYLAGEASPLDYTTRGGWPRTHLHIRYHPHKRTADGVKFVSGFRGVGVWSDEGGRVLAVTHPVWSRTLRIEHADRSSSVEQLMLELFARSGHLPYRGLRRRLLEWTGICNVQVVAEACGEDAAGFDAAVKPGLVAQGLWCESRDELDAHLARLPKRGPRENQSVSAPTQQAATRHGTQAQVAVPTPPPAPSIPTTDDDSDVWA